MTLKQKQLLDFIRECLNKTGVSPSYDEMAKHLGLKSKSGVHRLVHALWAHGEIERVNGMARSIALPSKVNRGEGSKWLKVKKIANDLGGYRMSAASASRELLKLAGKKMNLSGRPIPQKSAKTDKADGKRRMAKLAELGCVICGARPVEVHHCIHDRFSQKRASDMETIPLCLDHHRIGPDAIHNGKAAWREKYGPDHGYLKLVDEMLGEWF